MNISYMQMLYNNWHTDSKHFIQYEEYKEWLEELERQKEELFRRQELSLPEPSTMIDYSLDYRFELDRLKELWYRKYCVDLDYREHNAWLEETENWELRLHLYKI